MEKLYDVAVVGATGLVGRNILKCMDSLNFPVGRLLLFSSEKSAGSVMTYREREITVLALNGENVIKNRADIAFFCAGSEVSKKFAPLFNALGITVIDNSSAFRMDENVPLVVPEINPADIILGTPLIANPNCSTIQAMMALAPLHKRYGIKRIVYSTYQAVSGAGINGIESLKNGSSDVFGSPIAYNVIAKIGNLLDTGYTEEEVKMINESKKILHDDTIAVTATAVRVPVFCGHCISVNVQLNYSVSVADIIQTLSGYVKMSDFPTPLDAEGKGDVLVGRLRRDFSFPNSFNMWIVADNVLKGAALNAVQIGLLCCN